MSVGEELLALAEHGDERAIKRAYARLLRTNRPDEDADAFQDLHAFYQHALALCRGMADPPHDAVTAEPNDTYPAEASWHVIAEDNSESLDPHAVAHDIVQRAAVESAASLADLLQDRALRWSMHFRHEVSWAVLELLQRTQSALSEAQFHALVQAFGWDDIALDVDPLWLATVARRSRQAWQLLPASRPALRISFERCSNSYLSAQETDEAVARLREPRPRWRNRLDALVPTRARNMPFLLAALEYWPYEEVPAGLDAGQVRFWARFGDDAQHVHLRYGAIRCAIIGAFLGLVTAWGVYSSPAVGAHKGTFIIATATLMVPAGWLLTLGARALLRWQCIDEAEARGPVWLRWAFIPVAAATVGAIMWTQRALGMDGLLLMALDRAWVFGLSLIAMTRARVRGPDPHGEANGLPLVLGMILPLAGIVVSLVYWTLDLRRNKSVARR